MAAFGEDAEEAQTTGLAEDAGACDAGAAGEAAVEAQHAVEPFSSPQLSVHDWFAAELPPRPRRRQQPCVEQEDFDSNSRRLRSPSSDDEDLLGQHAHTAPASAFADDEGGLGLSRFLHAASEDEAGGDSQAQAAADGTLQDFGLPVRPATSGKRLRTPSRGQAAEADLSSRAARSTPAPDMGEEDDPLSLGQCLRFDEGSTSDGDCGLLWWDVASAECGSADLQMLDLGGEGMDRPNSAPSGSGDDERLNFSRPLHTIVEEDEEESDGWEEYYEDDGGERPQTPDMGDDVTSEDQDITAAAAERAGAEARRGEERPSSRLGLQRYLHPHSDDDAEQDAAETQAARAEAEVDQEVRPSSRLGLERSLHTDVGSGTAGADARDIVAGEVEARPASRLGLDRFLHTDLWENGAAADDRDIVAADAAAAIPPPASMSPRSGEERPSSRLGLERFLHTDAGESDAGAADLDIVAAEAVAASRPSTSKASTRGEARPSSRLGLDRLLHTDVGESAADADASDNADLEAAAASTPSASMASRRAEAPPSSRLGVDRSLHTDAGENAADADDLAIAAAEAAAASRPTTSKSSTRGEAPPSSRLGLDRSLHTDAVENAADADDRAIAAAEAAAASRPTTSKSSTRGEARPSSRLGLDRFLHTDGGEIDAGADDRGIVAAEAVAASRPSTSKASPRGEARPLSRLGLDRFLHAAAGESPADADVCDIVAAEGASASRPSSSEASPRGEARPSSRLGLDPCLHTDGGEGPVDADAREIAAAEVAASPPSTLKASLQGEARPSSRLGLGRFLHSDADFAIDENAMRVRSAPANCSRACPGAVAQPRPPSSSPPLGKRPGLSRFMHVPAGSPVPGGPDGDVGEATLKSWWAADASAGSLPRTLPWPEDEESTTPRRDRRPTPEVEPLPLTRYLRGGFEENQPDRGGAERAKLVGFVREVCDEAAAEADGDEMEADPSEAGEASASAEGYVWELCGEALADAGDGPEDLSVERLPTPRAAADAGARSRQLGRPRTPEADRETLAHTDDPAASSGALPGAASEASPEDRPSMQEAAFDEEGDREMLEHADAPAASSGASPCAASDASAQDEPPMQEAAAEQEAYRETLAHTEDHDVLVASPGALSGAASVAAPEERPLIQEAPLELEVARGTLDHTTDDPVASSGAPSGAASDASPVQGPLLQETASEQEADRETLALADAHDVLCASSDTPPGTASDASPEEWPSMQEAAFEQEADQETWALADDPVASSGASWIAGSDALNEDEPSMQQEVSETSRHPRRPTPDVGPPVSLARLLHGGFQDRQPTPEMEGLPLTRLLRGGFEETDQETDDFKAVSVEASPCVDEPGDMEPPMASDSSHVALLRPPASAAQETDPATDDFATLSADTLPSVGAHDLPDDQETDDFPALSAEAPPSVDARDLPDDQETDDFPALSSDALPSVGVRDLSDDQESDDFPALSSDALPSVGVRDLPDDQESDDFPALSADALPSVGARDVPDDQETDDFPALSADALPSVGVRDLPDDQETDDFAALSEVASPCVARDLLEGFPFGQEAACEQQEPDIEADDEALAHPEESAASSGVASGVGSDASPKEARSEPEAAFEEADHEKVVLPADDHDILVASSGAPSAVGSVASPEERLRMQDAGIDDKADQRTVALADDHDLRVASSGPPSVAGVDASPEEEPSMEAPAMKAEPNAEEAIRDAGECPASSLAGDEASDDEDVAGPIARGLLEECVSDCDEVVDLVQELSEHTAGLGDRAFERELQAYAEGAARSVEHLRWPGLGLVRAHDTGLVNEDVIYKHMYKPRPVRGLGKELPSVAFGALRPAVRNGRTPFTYLGLRAPGTADHARCWMGHLLLKELKRGRLQSLELSVNSLRACGLRAPPCELRPDFVPTWLWRVRVPSDRGESLVEVAMVVSPSDGVSVQVFGDAGPRAEVYCLLRQYCDDDGAEWRPAVDAARPASRSRERRTGAGCKPTLGSGEVFLSQFQVLEANLLRVLAGGDLEQESANIADLLTYARDLKRALQDVLASGLRLKQEWRDSAVRALDSLTKRSSQIEDRGQRAEVEALLAEIRSLGVRRPEAMVLKRHVPSQRLARLRNCRQ